MSKLICRELASLVVVENVLPARSVESRAGCSAQPKVDRMTEVKVRNYRLQATVMGVSDASCCQAEAYMAVEEKASMLYSVTKERMKDIAAEVGS